MFISKFWSQVCGGQSQARLSGDSHLLQLDQVSLILNTLIHTHSYGSWTAWGTRMFEGTRTQEAVVSLTLIFTAIRSCDLYPRVAANPRLTFLWWEPLVSVVPRVLSALLPINKVKWNHFKDRKLTRSLSAVRKMLSNSKLQSIWTHTEKRHTCTHPTHPSYTLLSPSFSLCYCICYSL